MEQGTMGARIKELRKERNLTQRQLAHEIGISFAAIRNYENNLREPNSKAMVALERFFNVSGEYLRGELNQDIYLAESAEIQDELDRLVFMFKRFSSDYRISDLPKQRLSLAALEELLTLLSAFVLPSRCFVEMTAEELCTPMRAVFDLNTEGRVELVKRATELTELSKYKL